MSGQEQDLGDKAQDAAREAADSRWVDRVSRAGLAARAAVYLMVGYLAGRVALTAAGVGQASTVRPASGGGALEALAEHPAGRVALGLLAAGFLGYALLALVQAGFRHQNVDNPVERRASGCSLPGWRCCMPPCSSTRPRCCCGRGPDRPARPARAPRRPS